MVRKTENTPEAPVDAGAERQECHHYWIIEEPRGSVSRGRCKFCGKEREFTNIFTASWWEDDDISSLQRSTGLSVQTGEEGEE